MTKFINKTILIVVTLFMIACNNEENYIEPNLRAIDLHVIIDENPDLNQFIGKVKSSINIGTVTYRILSQSPANSFSINSSTGEVYVNSPALFDFEKTPVIYGIVKVLSGDVSKNVKITLTLKDINEVNAFDFETSIYETPAISQSLGVMRAQSNSGVLNFKLLTQKPENAIAIDPESGHITVLDSLLFNFDLNPSITGKVRVSSGEAYDEAEIKINMIKEDLRICYGSIILRNNTELEYFVAQNYHTITKSLIITDDQTGNEIKSLETLNLLSNIGGKLQIDGLEFITDLTGLEQLIEVGSLIINNNKALLNVDALSNLVDCKGDITINDNEVFEFYCGLQPLLLNPPPFINGSVEANKQSTIPPPLPHAFIANNNLFNPKVEDVIALDCD